LRAARDVGLDLVEVAPNAVPPVCRILDYGKFKYEQTKKEREARRNQRIAEVKGMRLRPKIDDHDLEFKSRLVGEFLRDGDKVKVTVMFRGREIARSDLGRQVLEKMLAMLRDVAVVERPPFMEGKTMTMILAPLVRKPGDGKSQEPAPKPSAPALKPKAEVPQP